MARAKPKVTTETSMHIKAGRELRTKVHVARLQGFKKEKTMQDFVIWAIERGIDAVNEASRRGALFD
jgi:hypothetical protein